MADHASHAHAHGHEQHGSAATYTAVFVALLILTITSFAVGNWQDLKTTLERLGAPR